MEARRIRVGMKNARGKRMRNSIAELRAARFLHRWLRRAALSAIPIAGLSGCGSQCDQPDYDLSFFVDAGVSWASGSQHSPSECVPYCGSGTHDICFTTEITGCTAASPSTVTCHNHYTYCAQRPCGRLPPGLKEIANREQPSLVAAHMADSALLEGAAVVAFQTVERELIAHGAPAHLVARARSAQRDEMRHHAAMSRLADRFGAQVPAIEVEHLQIRTMLELGIENAVEGCVRETYGAAVAAFQGEWAQGRPIRRAMRGIARDEAEHASLGWAIDAWIRPRLQPGERALVEAARQKAREQVLSQARLPVAPELTTQLGLPDAAASAQLIVALAPLWS
jgi:hypothetical protein